MGFGRTVGQLRRAMRWSAALMGGATRSVLVLRLAGGEALRARIGPARFERLVDSLIRRLTIGLGMIPQTRWPGQTEIVGLLPESGHLTLPQCVAVLGQICADSVDLGDLDMVPWADAVIVRGAADVTPEALTGSGRQALAGLTASDTGGQVRVIEHAPEVAGPISLPCADRLNLRYQPQICCDTGRLVALSVRLLMEGPFSAPIALEQAATALPDGRAQSLYLAALRQLLATLVGWQRCGHEIPFLSLRLSERALSDPLLTEAVLWELERQDLQPAQIEIAFSEPAGHPAQARIGANILRLGAAGCRIAITDFGSGGTGLDALRGFGVRRVRIGRGLVSGCDHRGDQQRMILAILALAENLGVEVLAGEVTTADERAFLTQIGFSAVEGRAVAPSMPADLIAVWLHNHRAALPQGLQFGRPGRA